MKKTYYAVTFLAVIAAGFIVGVYCRPKPAVITVQEEVQAVVQEAPVPEPVQESKSPEAAAAPESGEAQDDGVIKARINLGFSTELPPVTAAKTN